MQHVPTLLVLSLASALINGTAIGQQQFDGHWSIEAIPESGTCKRAYRYPVVIENGTIRSGGSRRFNIAGAGLQADGRVRGSIQRNKTRVDVTGSLSERSGAGTWSTVGRVNCAGQWNAEKRS